MKLNNLTEIQKKFIKYILIGVGTLILLFVVLLVIKLFKGNVLSFEKIEDKMVNAADSYYKTNPHLLPDNEVDSKELDVNTLIDEGYMKELDEYTAKGVDCTGKVVILKNGSHYTFVPKLNCGGDYTTNSLSKKITSKSNIVTKGDGIYEIDGDYVFRGEKLNNYVSFAGKTWRILRITKDNKIRLIQDDEIENFKWDDRYNVDLKKTSGINNFNISRIKDTLQEIYNTKTFSATDKAKIIPKQLCIGKRSENDSQNNGSIECKELSEQYLSLGLLQVNEYLITSLDSNCKTVNDRSCSNYNYLSNYDNRFWTITPSKENTADVFYIEYLPDVMNARNKANIKLVIDVSGEVNYIKGNGTLEKPYIID